MDKLHIEGGHPLRGFVPISGAKNAALPLLAGCLLSDKPQILRRVPRLADTASMLALLEHLGTDVEVEEDVAHLKAAKVDSQDAPYDLVRRMRASILVLGPLLARFGRARIALPGGCVIGPRPVDMHLEALVQMGASIDVSEGDIIAWAPKGLHGASITLPFPSVGATENVVMAATLARGETVLSNAACEPEIDDLIACLVAQGACIEGAGRSTIHIQGQRTLGKSEHTVIPDRLEVGSMMCAGLATGGSLELAPACEAHMTAVTDALTRSGAQIRWDGERCRVEGSLDKPLVLKSAPYPGFPTDLQAQFMVLSLGISGVSQITEAIFENRFIHVQELCRLGAEIVLNGQTATMTGGLPLKGAPVMASDIRAGMALVIGGLMAQGETTVHRVYHIDRGYERLCEKLRAVGASIGRSR